MALPHGYNILVRHRSVCDYMRLAALPVLLSAAYEVLAIIPRALDLGYGATLQVSTGGCLLVLGLGGVIGWWMAIRWRGTAFDDFLAGALFGLGSGLISSLAGCALMWWTGLAPLTPTDWLLDLIARPVFTGLWAGVGALAVALVSKFIEVW